MKNKTNNKILTIFFALIVLVLISQNLFIKFIIKENFLENTILILFLSIISSFFFKYFLSKNNIKLVAKFENLLKENEILFKSNERYDIVAKATSDTIWDWNLKTGEFVFNKGICGIYGYKQNEIEPKIEWWFSKIHDEDVLKVSVNVYSFVEQKLERWDDYYRFKCADGTFKYVYDRVFLVMDENQDVVRVIGAMQDITKLKKEEQRLKLLETVITQSKDAVILTEANENSSKIPKILFVNPAFTKLTGYKPKEVLAKPPNIFMNKDSMRNDFKKVSESLKKMEEFTFESLNINKDGNEYWVNITMIPITNFENEQSHWISIQRDITEEKIREKEKEQLINELTQNNKDLKQFSYITSHNLRAPLSNLTGLINLLEDIPIENIELKEILNGFSVSTNQLNETINDLVKVIIIKDSHSIEKEELKIIDVFENVFNQLNFLISIKKPIIKTDLDKAPFLKLNKSYFESILLNLMTNSLKYNDENRQLKINISSKKVGNDTIVTFKDNGIGIDLERNKDKVFGLYQRFHDYADSKGLGLYLVKSQVESMNGNIAIESEIGIGTTFKITFKNN